MERKITGLFDRIVCYENLLAAYYEARKGKMERPEILCYSTKIEDNLHNLMDKLIAGEYRVGHYRQFIVTIPKPRIVMALGFEDRIVQWAIYRVLYPYLDRWQIRDSYGCRKGKGGRAAVERLQYWLADDIRSSKNGGFLKLDVTKFFYRVDHEIILSLFDFADDPRFLRLMDIIVNNPDKPFGIPIGESASLCPPEKWLYDVGMPIGNLSSQMIANMYLNVLDQHVKHDLRCHQYNRYMDDMILLSTDFDALKYWRDDIAEFVQRRLKLQLNDKTLIGRLDDGIDFVGHIIYPTHSILRRQTVKHIKNSIRYFQEAYRLGELSWPEIKPRMASYYGMMKHSDTLGLQRWVEDNTVFRREDRPCENWETSLILSNDGAICV